MLNNSEAQVDNQCTLYKKNTAIPSCSETFPAGSLGGGFGIYCAFLVFESGLWLYRSSKTNVLPASGSAYQSVLAYSFVVPRGGKKTSPQETPPLSMQDGDRICNREILLHCHSVPFNGTTCMEDGGKFRSSEVWTRRSFTVESGRFSWALNSVSVNAK